MIFLKTTLRPFGPNVTFTVYLLIYLHHVTLLHVHLLQISILLPFFRHLINYFCFVLTQQSP